MMVSFIRIHLTKDLHGTHRSFDFVEVDFDLRPVPDANLSNGIRLRYVQKFIDVSDSQSCMLREDLRNAIVLEAGSLLLFG